MSLLFYFILYLLPFSWWVFLLRQKETLDGLTSGYLYVLFSPCCIQREANKKSNKILANLKVEWLKYTITNICTSIHVYLLVFCFTYHCSLSSYRLSFVRAVSLNTQSRYIWHERARLCSALLCYIENRNPTNSMLLWIILPDIFMKIRFWSAFSSILSEIVLEVFCIISSVC